MKPHEVDGLTWSEWYHAADLTPETVTTGAREAWLKGVDPELWTVVRANDREYRRRHGRLRQGLQNVSA